MISNKQNNQNYTNYCQINQYNIAKETHFIFIQTIYYLMNSFSSQNPHMITSKRQKNQQVKFNQITPSISLNIHQEIKIKSKTIFLILCKILLLLLYSLTTFVFMIKFLFLGVITLLLFIFFLINYLILIRVDPGVIPKVNIQATGIPLHLNLSEIFLRPKSSTIMNMKKQLSFCKKCNIFQPPSSYHCQLCNVCIEKRSHHCSFLSLCIGKRNFKYYIIYIILQNILVLIIFPQAIYLLAIHAHTFNSLTIIQQVQLSLNCLFIPLLIIEIVTLRFLYFYLYIATTGQTDWQFKNNIINHSSKGIGNWVKICGHHVKKDIIIDTDREIIYPVSFVSSSESSKKMKDQDKIQQREAGFQHSRDQLNKVSERENNYQGYQINKQTDIAQQADRIKKQNERKVKIISQSLQRDKNQEQKVFSNSNITFNIQKEANAQCGFMSDTNSQMHNLQDSRLGLKLFKKLKQCQNLQQLYQSR